MAYDSKRRKIFLKIIVWIIVIFMVLTVLTPFIQYIFTATTPAT